MRLVLVCTLLLTLATATAARADTTTSFGDAGRTGWYPDQPTLGVTDVQSDGFGQIFSTPVVGQVYAQPLVYGGAVLVVTEENRIYSLDEVTGRVLWTRHLDAPFDATAPPVGCSD